MLLEAHGQAIIIKNHLKDGFKGLWNGTDVQQLKGNFMDTLFIVYGKVLMLSVASAWAGTKSGASISMTRSRVWR